MLQDLTIVHRRKPLVFGEGAGSAVWATCLRSLAFVQGPPAFVVKPADEIYSNQSAYQFLLEIVCGLHSPIVGETEVFGQFKAFASTWVAEDPRWAPWVQRLLNDAKALRSQYLNGLGTQSYGSWLRKNLTSQKIHLLGAGHLAQQIAPYLAKHGEVIVHARSPEKVDFHRDVRPLRARGFDFGALVVAAPMSAAEIEQWLGGQVPTQIFDLRDNSSTDAIHSQAVSLQHIFGQIESTRARLQPIVERIKKEIQVRSLSLAALEKVRPLGWDDICA
jgi:glutamyl-tRNA reductase